MDNSKMADVKHGGHRDANLAYHVTWDFRPEAIFLSQKAPTTNFAALATNLRDWMAQQGTLKYGTSYEKVDQFANPHTQLATQLNVIYASVLNEAHSFANDVSPMDPLETEIKRIRLNTELTLFSARDGLEGEDHYKVVLWPSEDMSVRVVERGALSINPRLTTACTRP